MSADTMQRGRVITILFVLASMAHDAKLQRLQQVLHDANLQRLSVVVDTTETALQQAKNLWHHLMLQDRNLTITLFTNDSDTGLQASTLSGLDNLLSHVPAALGGLVYSTVLRSANVTRKGNGDTVLVIAGTVTDDTTARDKELSNTDYISKQIKVHVLWLGKNSSQGAALLTHLANITGGRFWSMSTEGNETRQPQDGIRSSRRMRWPTEDKSTIRLQSSVAVIDPADPDSLTLSNTSALRRNGQISANYRILNAPVTVELSEQSILFAQPGQTAILYIEITNNYERQLFFYYYCNTMYSDVNIQPYWGWVQGGETVVVKVLLRVSANLQAPYDTVEFTASGAYTVTKKIYLYFGTQVEDQNKPEVSYTVNADCYGVDQPSLCQGTSWNLQATIRDKDSGLLRVTSLPEGILVPADFIVGSKDWVNVRYTSTCCNPKVDLIATDINGNQYRKSIDVNDIWLSPSTIIAIVLGVLLLLIILIIVVVAIVRFCIHRRRRRISFRTNP